MVFEHFAINVEHPVEMAQWYAENLQMKIVRSMNDYPFTSFLSDKTGRVVMEIYSNHTARIPDYQNSNPLEFHFAFMVEDVVSVKEKLLEAGASFVEDIHLDD